MSDKKIKITAISSALQQLYNTPAENPVTEQQPNKKNNENYNINAGIGIALHEEIARHGDAASEFFIGYRGVDRQTGQVFDRSLQKVATYKVNPEYAEQNIAQQAGQSAEIQSVSQKNYKAKVNKSSIRAARSEDVLGYGKNHNVVDILEIQYGKEISTSQMKFSNNPNKILDNITKGDSSKNDLSRYLSVDKLELPTEQVAAAKAYCKEQASGLRQQSQRLLKEGNLELAEQKLNRAKRYEELELKISDSGLTLEEARFLREHPKLATANSIAKASHSAGIEGAKFGAAIGGSISIISNTIALLSGEKEFSNALIDTVKDTGTSGGIGYVTAATGTAIKATMQQSSSTVARSLSNTNLPGMAISACLGLSNSIKKYANGDISEAELIENASLVAMGTFAGSAFTIVGQLAIPIPVIGGIIGGMIGMTISNLFHQEFANTLRNVRVSAERRQIIEKQCAQAIKLSQAYREGFEVIFKEKSLQLDKESQRYFSVILDPNTSPNQFCTSINEFAEIFGKQLKYKSIDEFEVAMLSNTTMRI